MIIQSPIDPRPPISTTEVTTVTKRTDRIIRSHDMRSDGLASAGLGLRANVADLDVVFVARARSVVNYCPLCPVPHPA